MTYSPRLREIYDNEIRGSLQKEFDYSNVMEIPKLDKIVLNMGVGAAVNDSKKVKKAVTEMANCWSGSSYNSCEKINCGF